MLCLTWLLLTFIDVFVVSVCCAWSGCGLHWRGCWYSLGCLLYQVIVLGVVVDINWSVCCIDLLCLAYRFLVIGVVVGIDWRGCCISLLRLSWLLSFIDVFVVSVCCVWCGC